MYINKNGWNMKNDECRVKRTTNSFAFVRQLISGLVFCGNIQMLIYIMAFPSLSTVWRFILFNEIIDRNLINIWINIIAGAQSRWLNPHLHREKKVMDETKTKMVNNVPERAIYAYWNYVDTLCMNVECWMLNICIKYNVSSEQWACHRFGLYFSHYQRYIFITTTNPTHKLNRWWMVTHSDKMKSFCKMCLTFFFDRSHKCFSITNKKCIHKNPMDGFSSLLMSSNSLRPFVFLFFFGFRSGSSSVSNLKWNQWLGIGL